MRLSSSLSSLLSRRNFIVVSLSLAALWFLAWGAARLLLVSVPLERADVMVVLSGSSTFVERTRLAAQLYSAGRADRIVLTNDNRQGGWLSAEQRNPYFYERARWELQRQGVPPEKIDVISTPVDGTFDEALVLREYAESHGPKSILLVTSAYHSRRAFWTFRRVLANSRVTLGLVAAPPGQQTPKPATWWLHLRGWQMVPGEYVKMVYYRFR